jgi:hypothetical protein
MILDSSSPIRAIQVDKDDALGGTTFSPSFLSRCLRQHHVIRNHIVSFRALSKRSQDDTLIFDRNPWWNRLLAVDDVPLNLWSSLLTKADTWKCDASHSNLDVLYFLLREKNSDLCKMCAADEFESVNGMAFRHYFSNNQRQAKA